MKAKAEKAKNKIKLIHKVIKQKEAKFIEQKNHDRECSHKIRETTGDLQSLKEQLIDTENSYKEETKRYLELETIQKNAVKNLEIFLHDNQRIIKEHKSCCHLHENYEYSRNYIAKIHKKLMQKEKEHEKLKIRINKKAITMYDKVEDEYNILQQKNSMIISDKEKIEKLIIKLDYEKKETIKKAWIKVNKNFG